MVFVGREHELERLSDAIQRVAEGGHGRLVLTGTAGIGITRLIDELVRRLAGLPGVVVARGAALESCAGEAYQAVGAALASAFGDLEDDRVRSAVGRAGHDLGRLLRADAARLDALGIDRSPPRLGAPDQLGSRVQEAVLGAFERLAGDGVVVLILEDLHRADPASRGLVRALLRIERRLPICLVLSYQPEELNRRHPARELLTLLSEDASVEVVEVGPLDGTAIGRLVDSLHDERPAGDIVAAVVEGAGGNPLVARQLVAAEGSLAGVRLSDPFEQIVGARLDALPAAPRRVVRLLAAARQPLPRASVLRLILPDGRITVAAIGEAVASGMVVERRGTLEIAHDLYAEAIEDHDLPNERASVHAVLATALRDRPARAAYHWRAAARPAEARLAHAAAVEDAAALDPGETTLFHLQRVLELSADRATGADPELGVLLQRASKATEAMGSFRRAAVLMRRAVEATRAHAAATRDTSSGPAVPLRDEALRLRIGAMVEQVGRFQWAGGDLAGGIRSMEQALTMMPESASPERAHALASLAQHLMIDGRFAESARRAEEARAVALEAGTPALQALGHATCTLGMDVAYLGELERGLALLAEADDIARRAGRLDDLMRAAANRTTLLDLDARRDEALAVVQDSIREAEAGGLAGMYGSFLRGNAADILYQLGRWSESERECRAGMEWQPAGVAWFSPTLYLGLVLVESRADDEAASLVGQTLLQLDTVPAGQWTALVQRAAVSLALWRGNLADAIRVADREWPRILDTDDAAQIALGASTCLEAAAAAAEHGRSERDIGLVSAATELADLVMADAPRLVQGGDLPPGLAARAEAELHLAMARAHRNRMRGRPSATTWARLAEAWTERRIPFQAAKARWWQVLALLLTGGSRDDARDAMAEAWHIASGLPATPLLRALHDIAARARLPLPDPAERVRELVAVPVVGRPARAMGPGISAAPRRPLVAIPVERPAVVAPVRSAAAEVPSGAAVPSAIEERLRSDAVAGPTISLSPREMEVLRVICEGRTDREIAERLFISERTVHVHVRHLLAKLGVASRTQAAAYALRSGLIPLGVPGTTA